MTNHNQPATFDVAIIGGGMVGLTMALSLIHFHQQSTINTPLSIAIIEFNPLDKSVTSENDPKCTAIAYGTECILTRLGLWQQLPISTHNAIKQIHVSARKRFGVTTLNAADYQLDAFGHVLKNDDLLNVLREAVHQSPHIQLISPAKVSHCQRQDNNIWHLCITPSNDNVSIDINMLKAHTLIVSDGARSELRQLLGLNIQHHNYHYDAIACSVTSEKPHNSIAYERFLMPGTLAMLPLGKQQFGVVWTMPNEQSKALLAMNQQEQTEKLQQIFGWRCGKLTLDSTLNKFPLHRIIAPIQSIPNAFLLGNTAHSLHPVAGQGFNLSARDVFVLSNLLIQHAFNYSTVNPLYQAARTHDQQLTNDLSHYLPKLFDINLPFSDLSRQLGLLVFDGLPLISKSVFVQQTMGQVANLPHATFDSR